MGRSLTEVHPLRPPNGTVHALLIIDRWHGTVAGKAPPVKGGIQKSLTKRGLILSLWAETEHCRKDSFYENDNFERQFLGERPFCVPSQREAAVFY